jgi:hypothetical protein
MSDGTNPFHSTPASLRCRPQNVSVTCLLSILLVIVSTTSLPKPFFLLISSELLCPRANPCRNDKGRKDFTYYSTRLQSRKLVHCVSTKSNAVVVNQLTPSTTTYCRKDANGLNGMLQHLWLHQLTRSDHGLRDRVHDQAARRWHACRERGNHSLGTMHLFRRRKFIIEGTELVLLVLEVLFRGGA